MSEETQDSAVMSIEDPATLTLEEIIGDKFVDEVETEKLQNKKNDKAGKQSKSKERTTKVAPILRPKTLDDRYKSKFLTVFGILGSVAILFTLLVFGMQVASFGNVGEITAESPFLPLVWIASAILPIIAAPLSIYIYKRGRSDYHLEAWIATGFAVVFALVFNFVLNGVIPGDRRAKELYHAFPFWERPSSTAIIAGSVTISVICSVIFSTLYATKNDHSSFGQHKSTVDSKIILTQILITMGVTFGIVLLEPILLQVLNGILAKGNLLSTIVYFVALPFSIITNTFNFLQQSVTSTTINASDITDYQLSSTASLTLSLIIPIVLTIAILPTIKSWGGDKTITLLFSVMAMTLISGSYSAIAMILLAFAALRPLKAIKAISYSIVVSIVCYFIFGLLTLNASIHSGIEATGSFAWGATSYDVTNNHEIHTMFVNGGLLGFVKWDVLGAATSSVASGSIASLLPYSYFILLSIGYLLLNKPKKVNFNALNNALFQFKHQSDAILENIKPTPAIESIVVDESTYNSEIEKQDYIVTTYDKSAFKYLSSDSFDYDRYYFDGEIDIYNDTNQIERANRARTKQQVKFEIARRDAARRSTEYLAKELERKTAEEEKVKAILKIQREQEIDERARVLHTERALIERQMLEREIAQRQKRDEAERSEAERKARELAEQERLLIEKEAIEQVKNEDVTPEEEMSQLISEALENQPEAIIEEIDSKKEDSSETKDDENDTLYEIKMLEQDIERRKTNLQRDVDAGTIDAQKANEIMDSIEADEQRLRKMREEEFLKRSEESVENQKSTEEIDEEVKAKAEALVASRLEELEKAKAEYKSKFDEEQDQLLKEKEEARLAQEKELEELRKQVDTLSMDALKAKEAKLEEEKELEAKAKAEKDKSEFEKQIASRTQVSAMAAAKQDQSSNGQNQNANAQFGHREQMQQEEFNENKYRRNDDQSEMHYNSAVTNGGGFGDAISNRSYNYSPSSARKYMEEEFFYAPIKRTIIRYAEGEQVRRHYIANSQIGQPGNLANLKTYKTASDQSIRATKSIKKHDVELIDLLKEKSETNLRRLKLLENQLSRQTRREREFEESDEVVRRVSRPQVTQVVQEQAPSQAPVKVINSNQPQQQTSAAEMRLMKREMEVNAREIAQKVVADQMAALRMQQPMQQAVQPIIQQRPFYNRDDSHQFRELESKLSNLERLIERNLSSRPEQANAFDSRSSAVRREKEIMDRYNGEIARLNEKINSLVSRQNTSYVSKQTNGNNGQRFVKPQTQEQVVAESKLQRQLMRDRVELENKLEIQKQAFENQINRLKIELKNIREQTQEFDVPKPKQEQSPRPTLLPIAKPPVSKQEQTSDIAPKPVQPSLVTTEVRPITISSEPDKDTKKMMEKILEKLDLVSSGEDKSSNEFRQVLKDQEEIINELKNQVSDLKKVNTVTSSKVVRGRDKSIVESEMNEIERIRKEINKLRSESATAETIISDVELENLRNEVELLREQQYEHSMQMELDLSEHELAKIEKIHSDARAFENRVKEPAKVTIIKQQINEKDFENFNWNKAIVENTPYLIDALGTRSNIDVVVQRKDTLFFKVLNQDLVKLEKIASLWGLDVKMEGDVIRLQSGANTEIFWRQIASYVSHKRMKRQND